MAKMDEVDDEEDDGEDPVSVMWDCFKLGFPLMTIYNALEPEVPLVIDTSKVLESKTGKAATFKFLQRCMTELNFPASECFLITDLYGDDTTGFVKVRRIPLPPDQCTGTYIRKLSSIDTLSLSMGSRNFSGLVLTCHGRSQKS